MDVIVLKDCVTETKVTPLRSKTSTSLARPAITYSFADQVEQEPKRMRVLPSPQAISRMKETLTWTACLELHDGKIVWLWAYGYR